jgi:hypothetical protein
MKKQKNKRFRRFNIFKSRQKKYPGDLKIINHLQFRWWKKIFCVFYSRRQFESVFEMSNFTQTKIKIRQNQKFHFFHFTHISNQFIITKERFELIWKYILQKNCIKNIKIDERIFGEGILSFVSSVLESFIHSLFLFWIIIYDTTINYEIVILSLFVQRLNTSFEIQIHFHSKFFSWFCLY